MTTQTTTHQVTSTNFNLLKTALRGNALFSVISAVVTLVTSGSVAEFMGVEDNLPFIILGVGLVLWAVDVYFVSSQDPIRPDYVKMIIGGDLLWVAGSAVLLLFDPFDFSTAGMWAVLVVADIVLTFAIVQYVGLRRTRR
ncbi:MAG: hypothetical protein L0154_04310 [Chloroflexi bacterium]|nr:hypothetical protein [Chloroflexota bacterium]